MSAVTTGALALDLWRNHKSTNQLAAVQLSDAGEEVTKAYKGIATLTAGNATGTQQTSPAARSALGASVNSVGMIATVAVT